MVRVYGSNVRLSLLWDYLRENLGVPLESHRNLHKLPIPTGQIVISFSYKHLQKWCSLSLLCFVGILNNQWLSVLLFLSIVCQLSVSRDFWFGVCVVCHSVCCAFDGFVCSPPLSFGQQLKCELQELPIFVVMSSEIWEPFERATPFGVVYRHSYYACFCTIERPHSRQKKDPTKKNQKGARVQGSYIGNSNKTLSLARQFFQQQQKSQPWRQLKVSCSL